MRETQVFSSCRYDGQIFVKPPEVLARDRLLGAYEVRLASASHDHDESISHHAMYLGMLLY